MKMLERYGVYLGYKFSWHSSHIKYLGVILPKDLSQLFDIKYNCRIKKIKDDLWGSYYSLLTLAAESDLKMNTNPRLLFRFLSRPVEIPQKQFSEWNKHVSRFIWDKKKTKGKVLYPLATIRGGGHGPSILRGLLFIRPTETSSILV